MRQLRWSYHILWNPPSKPLSESIWLLHFATERDNISTWISWNVAWLTLQPHLWFYDGQFRTREKGYDSAQPHTVAETKMLLQHFRWEVFDNPLYISDLDPSDYRSLADYYLLAYSKCWLWSHHFCRRWAADQLRELAESTGSCFLWQGY